MIDAWIGKVVGGEDLSQAEMAAAVDGMMQGEWPAERIGLLLTALRAKGESIGEIAGAAASMRQHMTRIRHRHTQLIDTCGTGGSGSGKFNISTAAALVTAAAGVPVAKHGNRSITSRSGSADVLAELGVNIQATVPQVEACLDELGICFCFAPLMHQAMKHVMPVRKQLGVPTIFNLLGPLCNPAGAPFQLLGVGKPELREKLAGALALLGTQRAAVVWGSDGLDEVTLGGATEGTEVTAGGLSEFRWTPGDFGLKTAPLDQLTVSGPTESAGVIRRVLKGDAGPARDIVLMNAAAALWIAGQAATLPEGVASAAQAVDSGAARELLEKLAVVSHRAE